MKPLSTALLLAALLAAASLLGACDPATPAVPITATPAPVDPDDAPPPTPEAIEAEVKASQGKTCIKDADCAMYLRCSEALCAIPPAMDGGPLVADQPALAILTGHGEAQFRLELAAAPDERSRGLMYRPRMHDDWGMLFLYPQDRDMVFWMKNTYIPLDMVFINNDREVVGVVTNATPLTLDERKVPNTQSRYVLELGAGVATKRGIQAGQKVIFANIPD